MVNVHQTRYNLKRNMVGQDYLLKWILIIMHSSGPEVDIAGASTPVSAHMIIP